MLYKMSEWQSVTGYWHCNCVDDLAGTSGLWWVPARIMSLTPAAYIKWVIKEYKPDKIYANKEKCLVFFSWKNQTQMRKFKNQINKKAREKNFQI